MLTTPIGGDDYQVVDSNLTFPSGSNEDSVICYNITINDDQCFEKDEYFRLSIGATEFNVDVGRNTTIITIRDEDGKGYYILYIILAKNETMAPLHVAVSTVQRELPKYELASRVSTLPLYQE